VTPSEATDWIVAALAAYPSVAREEFINKLMVEILLSACMAPVLASLESKYCILKVAVYFLVCCSVMAVLKVDMLFQQYKINRREGSLREAKLCMLNTVTVVVCVL
jgi:hypothetical protein